MKLLHISTLSRFFAFLEGQIGSLQSHGFEISLACAPDDFLLQFGKAHGCAVYPIHWERRITPLTDLVALWKLVLVMRRLRPDVVHAHTPKAGLFGILAACLAGVPVRIFQLHGLPHETRRGWRRLVLTLSTATACRFASRVIGVSRSVTAAACDAGLCSAGKISVFGSGSVNGIDALSKFNPTLFNERHQIRKDLKIPEGARVLGFVGRIAKDKGVSELASCWRELASLYPDLHLVVGGEWETNDPVPTWVRDVLANDPRIHLAGWIEDLAPLYSAMDVLVLPSHREGLGLVLLEAASMELPTVTTDATGCVDAVIHNHTGLIVPVGDAGALRDAIARYLDNADLRREHGRQGRRRVLADFQPQRIWSETAELYIQELGIARRSFYIRYGKRGLDLLLSLGLAIFWMPLALLTAIAVRIALGSPILLRQSRPGLLGQSFTMLKFRSVAERPGCDEELVDDTDRPARFGRILRATGLNGLPELMNVLRGEMSLVGPRPLLSRRFPFSAGSELVRFEARPGITGLAQISGRGAPAWDAGTARDLEYVTTASFKGDVRILALTVWRLFRRDGVQANPAIAVDLAVNASGDHQVVAAMAPPDDIATHATAARLARAVTN